MRFYETLYIVDANLENKALEKAMEDKNNKDYDKYLEIRKRNLHKMKPIPVCKMDDE